tara:strand:+ start:643 stop:837 length:195 start_codon:yes stop_codon:yes gene_type:complete
MSNIELLTCHEVMRLTGIRSRTTIWRRIRRGVRAPPDRSGGALIDEAMFVVPIEKGWLGIEPDC